MLESAETPLQSATPNTARILERALSGQDLSESDIVNLFGVTGADQPVLLRTADRLRAQTVGEVATYVVNRNINFTNVCVKRCGFCAFSRTYRSQEGYYLPMSEIVRRAREASDYGAPEVCIQAGLAPEMEGDLYIRICRAVKDAVPELHIHAFSPEEILYGSRQSGMTIREYLRELKDAGIGSLPGTSAEILDDQIRNRISPGRISTSQWIEVITTAHGLGIPTTCTIMYGHLETKEHCARHLLLLRNLQRESRGFTEFVPLSFVHTEAPMYTEKTVKGVRAGAGSREVLNMHAIARLVLNKDIPNIQVSWVKEGLPLSKACLAAGANDSGGTLMNESISTSAGSLYGQLVRPRDLRRVIREVGRVPAERSTLYKLRRFFEDEESEPSGPLDRLTDEEARRFGSYQELIHLEQFRFRGTGRVN